MILFSEVVGVMKSVEEMEATNFMVVLEVMTFPEEPEMICSLAVRVQTLLTVAMILTH